MKTEIVSFYCDIDNRTYYSDHATRLRINCNEHNMPHDIRQVESKGDYRLNCLTKPSFLLSVLEEKKKPFVWMDVDSTIHDELKVFDDLEEKCDIAFSYNGFPPNVDFKLPKASPIYLNYKPIVIEFLKFWIEQCNANIIDPNVKVFDHEILMGIVMPTFLSNMRVGALPVNYAIWPTSRVPEGFKKYITMGIADGESKEKGLREMGLKEHDVNFNLVGNI